jgi:long-subunit acyl-CoA synthetase (AMP-forming)
MLESLGTLIENFQYWEKNEPNRVYLSQPVEGSCREYTFAQAANQARRMANVLKSMQLPPQSHIGIVSKNCAHWIITDLAIQFAGHISVPFFPTLTAIDFNNVLVHSDCKVLFVGKLDDWDSMKSGVPNTIKCIAFPKFYAGCPSEGIDNWDDLSIPHL